MVRIHAGQPFDPPRETIANPFMRSLFQLDVQKAAGIAALATAVACYPRLVLWADRPKPLWSLWLVLLFGVFIFWSFVFAWHQKYTHHKVFVLKLPPGIRLAASICGLCGALWMYFLVDPALRSFSPTEYPTNFKAWGAMTLFTLAFDQLCLCFAPFAFFIRIFGRRNLAVVLTVLFGVLLLYAKLKSIPASIPPLLLLQLVAVRIVVGSLSLFFYLKGGAILVWWWVFLLQLRHLIALLGSA